MTRTLVAVASLVFLVGPLLAADPPSVTTKAISVSPAPAPKPALKYQLLPDLSETFSGNQAHLFMKAFAEQNHFYFNKDEIDKREKYLGAPLDELPEDVRHYGGSLINRLHEAARAEQVDWQLTRELKRDGTNTLIPDAQHMRLHANVLRVRCRGEIKAGHFPAAIRTVQTLLALGRAFNEHPCVIGQLVGSAIANIGLVCVEEMIQQPNCPNLYWALTDLPTPFIDLRKGIQGDRTMYDAEFRDFPRGGATWTGEQEAKAFARLPKMLGFLENLPPAVKRPTDFAPYVVMLSNDAEFQKTCAGWLKEVGYAENDIDGMTPAQRVIVASVERLLALNDETAKLYKRPYTELPDEFKSIEVPAKGAVLDLSEKGLFGGGLAVRWKPKLAQTRIDSVIAQLRMIEAVRLYAHAKGGKLPTRISDAGVPTPIDPFSGKAFAYYIEDDGKLAVFTITPPLGMEKSAPYNLRWKIGLHAK